MNSLTVFVFAAILAVALAGQYYVPRAYYTIDAEGHPSPPVPLRRLARSLGPYPYQHESAAANAWGNNGHAEANPNAKTKVFPTRQLHGRGLYRPLGAAASNAVPLAQGH